jgi:hypothetical protein
MKRCTKCNISKPLEEFSLRDASRGILHGNCKTCVSERYKAWYRLNHESEKNRAIASTKNRRSTNRRSILQYLLDHPCECGVDDPIVLQFHHLDPDSKHKDVSYMVDNGYAWSRIQDEINKCKVMCSNCHDRVTAYQVSNWKIAALAQSGRASVL